MKYIIANEDCKCSHCTYPIKKGDICIQNILNLVYHESCHSNKFKNDDYYKPKNRRPNP